IDEASEEVFEEFGLEVADKTDFDAILVDERGAAAEIDRDYRERFIHRQHEIARSVNAFAIGESFGEQLAYDYAGVFNCVVLIDVEIAFGFEVEIETAVFCEELEHVVEEANASRYFVLAA